MLERGDKIGDYTLAKFLGRGQFGEVWLAEKDVQFSTRKFQHALKFLFKREDEINLKTVEAEIDTWIEASGHPNVMSVLDMIVHREYIIIASEYAEGGSLKKWLNKHAGKAPSNEKALEMMTGILRGIEHLHSRNVVHRDLKPDNILLQGDFPRITDFGISRIVSAGSLSTVAMGSPFYMSPESFDGSKSTQTDIWSAGVILYEMLTGEHPYHSETIYGLVHAIKQDKPKPLPDDISPRLRKIVDTALQKDLSRRYPTAKAMRAVIESELHREKALMQSQHDIPKPEPVQPSPDLSLITFKEIDLGSNDNIQPPKKGKETHKTNVKDTLKRQPGDLAPDNFPAENESVPDAVPTLGWSHNTVTTNVDKQLESKPALSIPGNDAEPGVSFADSGFGNSQQTPAKRPWLLAAAVALFLALGLGGGLAGLFAVKRNSNVPVSNSDAATADPVPRSPESKENTRTPPEGMVFVRGGTFTMGRDDGEPEEKPAHRVTVKPFFMDIYEVTNRKYADFLNDTKKKLPAWLKRALEKEAEFPIVNVDWKHAAAYANWAGKRLPTEEEWEFAARASDGRIYPWGDEWDAGKANVESSALKPVGSYPCESPFKVCDLIGNAWEWTASEFRNYDGTTPKTNRSGKQKTRRGNCFEGDERYATTTYRLGVLATGADETDYSRMGFRCVMDVK